jgi:hypothetical protein
MIRKSTRDVQEIWRGVSMQRDGKYCMHKEHRDEIRMLNKEEMRVVVMGRDSNLSKEVEHRGRNAQ